MEIYQNRIPTRFTINGKDVEVKVEAGETALHTIRDRLGLKGTKEGCGIGECGACTIVVDGKAVNACLMLGAQLDGRDVLTVEGLELPTGLHPLQESFLDHHAVQCGFCTPGMILKAYSLLVSNPKPTRDQIISGMDDNLCRCGTHIRIVQAIQTASEELKGGSP
jgi:carbon-monoxide dehydrogenase small subunit